MFQPQTAYNKARNSTYRSTRLETLANADARFEYRPSAGVILQCDGVEYCIRYSGVPDLYTLKPRLLVLANEKEIGFVPESADPSVIADLLVSRAKDMRLKYNLTGLG